MSQCEILTIAVWMLALILVTYVLLDYLSDLRRLDRAKRKREEFRHRFNSAYDMWYDKPAKESELEFLKNRVKLLEEKKK